MTYKYVELGMMVQAYNAKFLQAKTERWKVQGQPEVQSNIKVSLSNSVRPIVKLKGRQTHKGLRIYLSGRILTEHVLGPNLNSQHSYKQHNSNNNNNNKSLGTFGHHFWAPISEAVSPGAVWQQDHLVHKSHVSY